MRSYTKLTDEIRENIAMLRSLGVSQKKTAELTGVSERTVISIGSAMDAANRKDIDTLRRLAEKESRETVAWCMKQAGLDPSVLDVPETKPEPAPEPKPAGGIATDMTVKCFTTIISGIDKTLTRIDALVDCVAILNRNIAESLKRQEEILTKIQTCNNANSDVILQEMQKGTALLDSIKYNTKRRSEN